MKIYLAARYSKNPEMREAAAYLTARGHAITSRWINGSHELGDAPTDEGRKRLAVEDFEDLLRADAVIFFSEPPRTMNDSRGGRHVEFGIALGRNSRILVVGPKENVFHYLDGIVHYPDLMSAAHALEY